MKVCIQWATDPHSKFEIIDSIEWINIPKKKEPDGKEVVDNIKGWIQSICVYGVTFKADHYSIVENPRGYPIGSVKVVMCNDDPQERTPNETYAKEWFFQPMKLKNKKWIPSQNQIVYISEIMKQHWEGQGILPLFIGARKVLVRPFSDFISPKESLIRHGVWLSNELNEVYERSENHSWREWL